MSLLQPECRVFVGGWLSLAVLVASTAASEPGGRTAIVSLDGEWRFQLDPGDLGVAGRWFERTLKDRIRLPGALQSQGFGNEVSVETPWTGQIVDRSWFTAPEYAKYRQPGNVKVPFWLQPERHYVGAAWYQRTVDVPAAWQGKPLVLTLERPHWETRVWLDDRELGVCNALSTPHVYTLGASLSPGPHRLTVRVDNRLVVDVGVNSHSVTDHTQSNWNGIVGQMTLEVREPVHLVDLQVFPRLRPASIRVLGRIANSGGKPGRGIAQLRVAAVGGSGSLETGRPAGGTVTREVPVEWGAREGGFQAEIPLAGAATPWDEFQPALCELTATLTAEEQRSVRFGLREIGTQGTQFTINGRKVFFRGTLECCIFPKTGYPPTEVDEWKRILGAAKAHGLNQMRFHSWCPPEAAFTAADELGFYFQVECASWANTSTQLGKGLPIDRWLYEEADRILAAYGNHPSFVLLTYGNEPAGDDRRYLGKWVEHYKKRDPRRLYSSASGWPQIPENQFHVAPDPRIQGWGAGLTSRINARAPETVTDYRDYIGARKVPVISHEIGQWCVYPNFAEIPKYTGHLKPKNFEVFRETLAGHQMADQAADFLQASGKLQALCYKEEIESALRTPGMGGFQLLDLHDFPGQGTALVGVLDPFWEPKGYISAEQYRRFCAATVPLARLARRVFTTGETLEADVELSHFGPRALAACVAGWKLCNDAGVTVAAGRLPARDVPVDNGVAMGKIAVPLAQLPVPARYRLVIGLEGTAAENDWDVWVYSSDLNTAPAKGLTVVEELTPAAVEKLRSGGRVLLLARAGRVKGDARGKPAFGFSSIFWNTAWTRGQAPHTLGILCDPRHPALAAFPSDSHSNWQWWYLVRQSQPMILDALPPRLRPVVQVIDDWFTNRRLGLVVEAKVAGGKLLISSIELAEAGNPVARQMLKSLQSYAAGDRFDPKVELTVEQVAGLFSPPSPLERLGAKVVKVDSAEPAYEGDKAIDGDPATIWHTAYTPAPLNPPHEIQLDLGRSVVLRGFTMLPRQDKILHGTIRQYACYLSTDGKDWGRPVAEGEFAADHRLKTVRFARPSAGRYFRLVAISEAKGGPWASIAELDVLLE